jgi:pimeloyl-ACP methyl ester carboxylesterase
MAPAFQLAARWRDMLGPAWDDWQKTGWREVTDFTTGQPARVDFGFAEDAAATDVGYPDVRVPTLIIHGTGDETVPVQRSRTFAAGKPHVRLIEVDDGHELVASLPRILAETETFLDALSS